MLSRLAARQDNLIHLRQLERVGFTEGEIRELVRIHHIHRIHRRVYALGTRRLTRNGWLRAALLAAGPEAFLSHRTAAGIRRLCGLNTYDIHLTVAGGRTRRIDDVTLHRMRRTPHRSDIGTVSGLRVASTPLILIQLAESGGETEEELAELVEAGIRRGSLELDALDAALARHGRGRNLRALTEAVERYRPRPFDKSGLERAIAQAIAADPEIPEPRRNVAHPDSWELDFLWEEERVVLEADGGDYHKTRPDVERDKRKDMRLGALGLQVVRITDDHWERDPRGALADLRAILRLRRPSGGAERSRPSGGAER